MSLHRLAIFLRDNFNEIIDYWIWNNKLWYVRIISKQSGIIYMVKVDEYDLHIDSIKTFEKTKCFYMEREHHDENIPETLVQLYEQCISTFPDQKNRILLHYSDYMLESRDTIYRIMNSCMNERIQMHFYVTIEWFYENIYIVHHEFEKIYENMFHHIHKSYKIFLEKFNDMIRYDSNSIHVGWSSIQEYNVLLKKSRSYFVQICGFEDDCHRSLHTLLTVTSRDEPYFGFRETVKRSYEKKQLQEKVQLVESIKKKMIEKIVFVYQQKNHYIFSIFLYISRMNLLLTSIQTHIIDFENKFKSVL
jgi:hypothetical protein